MTHATSDNDKLGRPRARAEDRRRRAGHPPADPARLRVGRARDRRRGAARLDHLRRDRRRPHRRRAGGRAGGDRRADAGARLSPLRSPTTRVILIEAGPRVLSDIPRGAVGEGARAAHRARHRGADRRARSPISATTSSSSATNRSRRAPCCGRRACARARSPLTSACRSTSAGRSGSRRISRCPIAREVFVVGDLIAKTQNGEPLPGVAQLAMQSGRHAAKNIRLSLRWAAARAVPLRRQGIDGHHRSPQGRGADRPVPVLGDRRLVALAHRAPAVAGRLSQSDRRS